MQIDLKPEASGARLRGLCPKGHDKQTPSFKLHVRGHRAGCSNCYGACHEGGDIIAFAAWLHNESQGRATVRMAEALGLGVPRSQTARLGRPKRDLRREPPSPEIVERLRAQLHSKPDRLKYLRTTRGLSASMVDEAHIGLLGDRFALPVYSADLSEVRDIRLYKPNAEDGGKMQGWRGQDPDGRWEGTGSPKLFLPPGWSQPTRDDTVLFAEGELDSLLLADLGWRAMTNTCGAGNVPANDDLHFSGARVVVIGDCDEAGCRHNDEVAKWAYAHGAEEVCAVLWPEGTPAGYDVTDALLQYGLRDDRARAARAFAKLLRGAVPIPERPLLSGPFEDFACIKGVVRATTWLWPSWIPNGSLTVIGGDQESGKSFLGLRLAHSVILGSAWPDGADGPDETGPVLWVEAEACHAVTAERAERMAIPLDQLKHIPTALDGWHFDNAEDLTILRLYARQEKVRMVLIDSLSTAYSGNENKSDTREPLSKLAAVARDLGIPIVLIHHLNKPGPLDTKEFNCDRLRGTSAIKQIARAIIGIDHPDPSNRARRVVLAKCNFLAEKPKPLGYTLEFDCQVRFGVAPEALKDETRLEQALELLVNALSTGERLGDEVKHEATEAGISDKTLRRAREQLGVKTFGPVGEKRWFWSL